MVSVERDENGRFVGAPPAEWQERGRQSQSRRGKTLGKAMRDAIDPDTAVEMWREAWEVAKSRGSPRSMIQVLELGLSYGYGKPTNTIELDTSGLDLLAVALRNSGPALPPRDEPRITVIDADEITYENPNSQKLSALADDDEPADDSGDSDE